ncbi:MAG: hypothetical protein RLZZ338_2541 [Cyanobacteriota bacterium]|jgi:hypothetical protein
MEWVGAPHSGEKSLVKAINYLPECGAPTVLAVAIKTTNSETHLLSC